MNIFIFIVVYLLIGGVLSVTEMMDSGYFEDESISVLEKIFSVCITIILWLPTILFDFVVVIINHRNKKRNE